MIANVPVSFNFCFHPFYLITLASMMCVFGSYYCGLHPMNEKSSSAFLIGKSNKILYVTKAYEFHDSYFVYVVEAIIILN
jgi:hypothetical protein